MRALVGGEDELPLYFIYILIILGALSTLSAFSVIICLAVRSHRANKMTFETRMFLFLNIGLHCRRFSIPQSLDSLF